ncbi:hypothetical protein FGADI_3516 [Fusarium gaditjirri]|uniref:Uncharacterized protein n=1 Tax=Fusarium gaditjirri TaxID=282569 RepID=A0A8H4WZT6_9HYPO|nr:hypothetical protein FGADI_3516 [Fusarium gaditjirri]
MKVKLLPALLIASASADTPDPYLETEVNTKTVVETEVNTHVLASYSIASSNSLLPYRDNLFRPPSNRAMAVQLTKNILRSTDIPSYAGSCTDAEKYSSACACMDVQATTIEGTGFIITETIEPHAETVVNVHTEIRPAVTITLPGPQITETTIADATTVPTSFTADANTSIITQQATEVDKTTPTKTRSVGPMCTTYTPSQTSCNCKFKVL